MNAASPTLIPRALHPWAWWGWALGIAVAVSMTTNPLLLLIAIGVLTFVVISRRGSSPWARAFKLYLWLGAFIIIVRMVLHVLVGLKFGDHLLITLPAITLPSWAAGINLLGPIYLEGLLDAALQGLRLATMIAAIGAANSLANRRHEQGHPLHPARCPACPARHARSLDHARLRDGFARLRPA